MSIKENEFVQKTINNTTKGKKENTSLLRIGVILMSIVSFYTTANGMKEYIFKNNGAVAYAASAAIQGILLALSMNLPEYLRKIWGQMIHWFWRLFLCICAVILTGVAIFCSSWFSYVYIASTIHQESWGTDSELLVQQTYRSELYNARDYAHTYRLYLEESIGEDILALENQARQIADPVGDFVIDWDEENANYGRNSDSIAATYMTTAIDAMALALADNSSQENRDTAVIAVADAKRNIEDRIESIRQELIEINNNIINYNNQIENWTRRINNAAEGTDTTALSNLINTNIRLIDNETQHQAALQMENIQLRNALFRLPVYESYLGLNDSTSSISIRSELIQMQSEFFRNEPDINVMLDIATKIFDDLRNASHDSSGGDNSVASDNSLTYTNLLVQMNRLIRNLTDYAEIKEIENELGRMITELRETDLDNASAKLGNESVSGNMPFEMEGITVSGNILVEADRSVSGNDNVPSDSATPPSNGGWKDKWGNRLNELKAQISAMPIYSAAEGGEGKENTALSEEQLSILCDYNRNKSSNELDDIIRRYIADHNAIYQGIIYLQSPYRSLALFAMILAFSFDIAGFIFGVAIQGSTSNIEKEKVKVSGMNKSEKAEWSILEMLNKYVLLTGDYERRDGIYYYKIFRNGILEQWGVRDSHPYDSGIYIQNEIETEKEKGRMIDSGEKELLFAGQSNGPVDGIYRNCKLTFDEGGLMLITKEKKRFIASVNEYVPIHSYDAEMGENQTIPMKRLAIKEIDAKVAVVALNKRGTQVAAVYIIENVEEPAKQELE